MRLDLLRDGARHMEQGEELGVGDEAEDGFEHRLAAAHTGQPVVHDGDFQG